MVGLIVGVVVSILAVGFILVPIVSDSQQTIGDRVTFTNETEVVLRAAEPGDVLLLTSTYGTDSRTDVWTLNGDTISGLSSSVEWDVGVMSDGYYLAIFSTDNASAGMYVDMDDSAATEGSYVAGASENNTPITYKVTFGDSTVTTDYTIGGSTTTETYGYTWGYVICPLSDGEYCAAVAGGSAIVSNADDVILCGIYTSGSNDTPYYYYDGVGHVANSSYTINVDVAETLHNGTTDVYDATVSVDISGETFTPYRILVPYEVTGHEVGASYNILAVVPVIVLIAILMMVVTHVFKREE